MSRLWPDRLYVAIGIDQLGIVQLKGRRGRSVRVWDEIEVVEPIGNLDIRHHIDALDQWLADHPVAHCALHVTLSDQFARYAILPDIQAIGSRRERIAYAAARLEERYGDLMSQWRVQYDANCFDGSAIACATNEIVVRSIHEVTQKHRLRLSSLAPAFIRFINRWHRLLPQAPTLFVSAVDRVVVSGYYDGQGWSQVVVKQLNQAPKKEEALLLADQAAILMGCSSTVSKNVILGEQEDCGASESVLPIRMEQYGLTPAVSLRMALSAVE